VNNARDLAQELFQKDLIDVIQLHGDESIEEVEHFLSLNIPVIRALSALNLPQNPLPQSNFALLIDTPAGQDYGGTGKTFDWSLAQDFSLSRPETPIILAGGITPENAQRALLETHPIALDVASGAEISPGIKDLKKVRSLMEIVSQ
jgi:phosphoribosylanthranilate isomerase